MPFLTKRLGPWIGGVTDAANPLTVEGKTVVRYARNAVLDGVGRLLARGGTQVALTLKDDQGSPATVTSVVALVPFGDGALAVGHSTITSKFYLYWLKDDLTDWYNSMKVLQGTTNVLPVLAAIWIGAGSPAAVLIAEGLNVAYLAHNAAGSSFKTMKFDTTVSPATLTAFQADLRGLGIEDTYFRGLVSFQQHLWGWGYGSQAANDGDRPELLRFSTPFFGAMAQSDNFAVGHRVRSVREKVVLVVVAGQVLYAGTNFSIWPVTGFGRNSWDKSRPIDDSYGFAGVRAAVAGPNGYLYYWSHRGPMRVLGYGPPEPLWPRVAATLAGVINEQNIVAGYDTNADQVVWLYQDQASGRASRLCAYDVLREAILGPDGDLGVGVSVAAFLTPIFAAAAPAPTGPPTTASTDGIGTTIATAHWVNGDTAPDVVTQLEYRTPQGSGTWIIASSTIPSGTTSFQLTGLIGTTAYEWRAKHIRNGISSVYLGPVAGSQFATVGQLSPPTNAALAVAGIYGQIKWTNSGESGVSTEVWFGITNAETLHATVLPGVGTYYANWGPSGLYRAKVRHVKTGFAASNFALSNQVTH